MTSVTIECPCPSADGGTRHPDGDTITLRETLGFQAVLAIRWAFHLAIQAAKDRGDAGLDQSEWLAVLSEQYLFHGIESWTLVDADGKPLPVTHAAIRDLALERPAALVPVTDAADELYTQVMLPLILPASRSSHATPTAGSTSPTQPSTTEPKPTSPSRSSSSHRTPSSPSSTTTTPTDAIETTSPVLVGASS